jgi:hypothetical protein
LLLQLFTQRTTPFSVQVWLAPPHVLQSPVQDELHFLVEPEQVWQLVMHVRVALQPIAPAQLVLQSVTQVLVLEQK